MKRVAVFGNAGGGKSTLSRAVAELAGLPLYSIDAIQFTAAGEVPNEVYLKAHADLIARDEWVIDGFGTVASAWERFEAADTLIYVDLALSTHYWWVTKRLLKSVFVAPEGWPENSPMWKSTLSGWRVVGLCHRHLTPKYRQMLTGASASKRVHHLRSKSEIRAFLEALKREHEVVPADRLEECG